MTESILSRRTVLTAAAAGAALLPLRHAIAQTSAANGDWFSMVKAQHVMIAKTFDQLLAVKSTGSATSILNALTFQLTAHSVAEENVLYPALAANGMMTESDKLYMDQAHAKVLNAAIDMDAIKEAPLSVMLEKGRTLQAAVLNHAKVDEEGNFYPKLQQMLNASQNGILSSQFVLQSASVKPTVIF